MTLEKENNSNQMKKKELAKNILTAAAAAGITLTELIVIPRLIDKLGNKISKAKKKDDQ